MSQNTCLPNPDAAPRRASRLPRDTSHRPFGSKGFYPRTHRTAARLPCARRRGDGRGESTRVGARRRVAEALAKQGKRRVGL